jgi:hypothetical protein
MIKLVTTLTVAMIVGQPVLAFANELKPGDRVEGAQPFFMCGAREDLASIRALERAGDKATALKVGMQRCEPARPGNRFIVVRAEGDALCVRPDGDAFCLWAWRSSLQVTPSQ